jgi:hypothetical protein
MTSVSGIVVVNENPPFVNGLANLYKYEPFSYQYAPASGTFFSNLVTNSEILSFTTSSSSSIVFQSVSGYQTSYNNAFPFVFELYSNSGTLLGTYSNNFRVNPGRFFPPVAGASNTFFVNEAITPVLFNTSAAMITVFTNPALPPGLSFSNIGGFGTQWSLQGAPIVQTPTTVYQFIGTNSNTSRIVTTTNSITVSPERLRLFTNGSPSLPLSIPGMTVDTFIPIQTFTASFPGAPAFTYQWSSPLPDGLQFTDISGNAISSNVFSFTPSDPSYTLILQGAPSFSAANTFVSSNISNYNVTLGGFQVRPGAVLSNIIPITFSFGETVLFTADPYSNLLYLNVSLNITSNIRFQAATYFSTGQSITNIFSPNLRTDLSISFNAGIQTAFLVSSNGPTYVSTDSFTLRAINNNLVTRDASLTIQTINDFITWSSSTPAINTCYSFIYSRPLTSAKAGYYPYPIQFTGISAAGQPVTYSASGFNGTNISITSNTLTGTPLVTQTLANAIVTATASNTGAFNTRNILYEVLDDVIDLSSTPGFPVNFRQNVAITPVQLRATTLSGRLVASYIGSAFPSGVTVSPVGKITGTPTSDISGAYSIIASTGLKSQTFTISYSMVPDTVLFLIDPDQFVIPPGSNVPSNMKYTIRSFSGTPTSNAVITPGNPTQFGIFMDTNGTFSGTMSTNVIPNTVVPQFPQRVTFNVSAQAGAASGDTTFYISALNANGARQYITAGTPASCNVLYYSIPTNLSNAPQSVIDSNYTNWFSGLMASTGYRATDVAVRYIDTSQTTVLVCTNNGTNGFVSRCTDGINFSNISIPSNSIFLKTVNVSNDLWAAAGVISGVPYLFLSSNDGVAWSSNVVPNLQTRAGTSTPYETYGLSIARVGGTNNVILGGGQYNTGGNETVVLATTSPVAFTSRSTLIKGEFAGSLSPLSTQQLYYGSEYYLTASGAPATFIPSPTMRGITTGSPFPIPGEFNFFCYDVRQAASNLFVATGVHNYGSGYVPEVRVSSNIFGIYSVTDLSSGTLFPASATPPKPNIGYGPVFSDASYVYVPVTTGGTTDLYRHLLQAPPLTNWISVSSSLGNVNITEAARSTFVTDSNCAPFVNFAGDPNAPVPFFTAPTQTDYLFYQYLQIDPITVTAQAGVGGGNLFLLATILPPGFAFDGATGIISGIPTQLGSQVLQIDAYDTSWNTFTSLNFNFNVLIPRFIHKQNGAGAYTSLLRQYTQVNAAQNSRDIRVLPTEERNQGAFAAPDGTDVTTQIVDPRCFDPKVCK